MSRIADWWRSWEITIDSNWITTTGMAFLFAFVVILLTWSIRNLLFGSVDRDLSHRIDVVTYTLGAVYCFLFAYAIQGRHVKFAFPLLGANYTAAIVLHYLRVSVDMQHSAAVIGSITKQVAFVIILFAIAKWFRAVTRWIPGHHGNPNS